MNMINKVQIDSNTLTQNFLFKYLNIECNLPSGSKLSSKNINEFKRVLKIKTKYSSLNIEISKLGGGFMDGDNINLVSKLDIGNFDMNQRYQLMNFGITINGELNLINRFAKEAKLHKKWHEVFYDKLYDAYSYEAFKTSNYNNL